MFIEFEIKEHPNALDGIKKGEIAVFMLLDDWERGPSSDLYFLQENDEVTIFKSEEDLNDFLAKKENINCAVVNELVLKAMTESIQRKDYIDLLPWKDQKDDKVGVNILSPDGFSFFMDGPRKDIIEAEEAFQTILKGYAHQGYYSTSNRDRIDLDDLRMNCKFLKSEIFEDDDE